MLHTSKVKKASSVHVCTSFEKAHSQDQLLNISRDERRITRRFNFYINDCLFTSNVIKTES